MEGKGLVHIYTGEGKGKTTSAVGLAARALGHNLKVCYVHFLKRPDLYGDNEIQSLEKLGATILDFTGGHPSFNKELTANQLKEEVREGLIYISEYVKTSPPDLLIMDEILIAVRDGFLAEAELIEFIEQKPPNMEVVLTGRDATGMLIEKADYVSYIQKIKHPFDQNIKSRKGIEY
ncbi:MAG: cob(I)yrinic acid a,c-diamide adenosyltransferase [Chlorobi bacterium]|nr:cob(I)yrinic acid a,c-diamide adenosyltransferase [Chlorobiota bacterium]